MAGEADLAANVEKIIGTLTTERHRQHEAVDELCDLTHDGRVSHGTDIDDHDVGVAVSGFEQGFESVATDGRDGTLGAETDDLGVGELGVGEQAAGVLHPSGAVHDSTDALVAGLIEGSRHEGVLGIGVDDHDLVTDSGEPTRHGQRQRRRSRLTLGTRHCDPDGAIDLGHAFGTNTELLDRADERTGERVEGPQRPAHELSARWETTGDRCLEQIGNGDSVEDLGRELHRDEGNSEAEKQAGSQSHDLNQLISGRQRRAREACRLNDP